jgi:hypothetical protein
MLCAVASAAIGLAHPTFAQGQFGTAAEAKAMLEKAVAAVKADKSKALDQIQKGEGGFKIAISTHSAPMRATALSPLIQRSRVRT